MKRAKPERVTTIGHNIGPTKDKIAAAAKLCAELEKKRSQINAELNETRTSVESSGITKQAFKDAVQYAKKEPDQRAGYDQSYVLCREAMGLPVQGVMFDLSPTEKESEAA